MRQHAFVADKTDAIPRDRGDRADLDDKRRLAAGKEPLLRECRPAAGDPPSVSVVDRHGRRYGIHGPRVLWIAHGAADGQAAAFAVVIERDELERRHARLRRTRGSRIRRSTAGTDGDRNSTDNEDDE